MPKTGIIYILIATFAFAWMNIQAKNLSNFNPLQVVFFRAIGTFVFILPYMLIQKVSLIGKQPKLLFLRAITGFLSLAAFFWAVQRISVGAAISIRYVGPVFAALLSYYFLKEKVNRWQWLSFIIAFSGVLFLKGVDTSLDMFSFFLVLFSALMVGIVFVLIRYLSAKEHILTIIFYFMVVCIIGSLFSVPYWRWPVSGEWFYVCSIGVFGLFGQVLMTQAFKLEETSTLAPFKYMELIYAVAIGFFLLGEHYTIGALLSMGLIIFGMVFNVYSKRWN